jgi:hypothetical protein
LRLFITSFHSTPVRGSAYSESSAGALTAIFAFCDAP